MIIIYDTNENKVLAGPMPEYKVDGKEGRLETHQIILNIVRNELPTINPDTQYITSAWVVEGSNYVLKHTVINKTTAELEQDIDRNVPEFITKKQFMLQLFEDRNLGESDVLTWIRNSAMTAKNKKRAEIEILYETKYYPTNLLLRSYLTFIGLTDRQAKIFYGNAIKL